MVERPGEGQTDVVESSAPSVEGAEPFDVFYRAEIARLVALAAGLCGRAAAEDIAQEAMLVTYRRWSEVSRRDHPEAFARRVCANLAVSTFRRRMVELRALLYLTDRSGQVQREAEVPEEFWRQVCRLPRRQAQAVALHYLYDLDVATIASTLEISPGSVKVHLHRGRLALASHFGTQDEEQP